MAAASAPLSTVPPLTLPFTSAEEPPLVALIKRLYGSSPSAADDSHLGLKSLEQRQQAAAGDDIPHFSFEHESSILCEPFANAHGVSTRPCLMGSSCIGRDASIGGHLDTVVDGAPGVILMEVMTPTELADFYERDALPADRRCCLLCTRYHVHTAYLHTRKAKNFPPSCLVNTFVNGHGENEYDKSFLIPSEDESVWTGIVGTVVGCHLNALRLVKDDEKDVWRIDQSALKHNNTLFNVTIPSLYRGRPDQLSPQTWLKSFYEHRHRVHDASLLFNDFEDLDMVKPKIDFDNLASGRKALEWTQGATKSFVHRLLYYRVNRLNTMLYENRELYGDEWAFNMQMYIDAHIPMVNIFEDAGTVSTFVLRFPCYEDTLPDLTAFLNQAAQNCLLPPGLTAQQRKQRLGRPRAILIALLVRVLPEYCQNKSLHSQIIKAMNNRELSTKFFQIFQCILMNNFRNVHACDYWPYSTRKAFLKEFTEAHMLQIMKNLPDHENFSMYVLKTYLNVVLPLCPPLQKFIMYISPLQKQIERVAVSMHMVRQTGSSDWTAMFSPGVLDILKKNHKRLPKKKLVPRGTADLSDTLRTVASKSLAKRGIKRLLATDVEQYSQTFKRARHWDGDIDALTKDKEMMQLAALFDAPSTAILKRMNDSAGKKITFLLDCDVPTDTVKQLHDFAKAVDDGLMCRLTILPQTFLKAAVQAVARRFQCEEDNWDVLRRVTQVRFCFHCGIKNFVLQNIERYPKASFSRKQSFERSAGYRKLAVSCDSGYMRCIETPECAKLELQTLDLIRRDPDTGQLVGGAWIGRKESVMVSPCCGYLCAVSSVRFSNNCFDCPACAASKKALAEELLDPRICSHCSKRSQLKLAMSHVVMLRDVKGRIKAHGFCRSHFRSWARCDNGYLDFNFVSLNMTNRSGNGLVLNPY